MGKEDHPKPSQPGPPLPPQRRIKVREHRIRGNDRTIKEVTSLRTVEETFFVTFGVYGFCFAFFGLSFRFKTFNLNVSLVSGVGCFYPVLDTLFVGRF